MAMTYFEDFVLHHKRTGGEYIVSKEEVIGFAQKWDPQPYHIDETKAKATIHGGVIASATHTLAISFSLRHQIESDIADIAGLELDEMVFPNPVRPGDRLSVTIEYVTKRESRKKPDRGIVTRVIDVRNQKGETVCKYKDVFLAQKRPR
ncbi:MAG: acyl dehydratase [bacterium]|nr:acyl dehydratase [bacterium]